MTRAGADHGRYEEWDGAYVLGALSTAERHEYETHLASCAVCQESIAALAAIPGLLQRLPADEAFALLDETPEPVAPPIDLTPSLLRAAARRRRTDRWLVAAVAAAAVVVALAVPPTLGAVLAPRPDASFALVSAAPSPLTATVALTGHDWGTSIEMDCAYALGGGYGPHQYILVVTDTAGTTATAMSWTAKPGDEVRLTAATAVPESGIRGVELRDAATGATLLRADL